MRAREGLFLVEGIRGVREFLRATIPMDIRFALVSARLRGAEGGGDLRATLESRGVPVEEVEHEELMALSDTEQSQGVLLVIGEPEDPWPDGEASDPCRVLVLDGIQDPGNVGTLIRVARGFGLDGVIALEGTVDPWNSKAVRSSAGAAAHLHVAKMPWCDARAWLRSQDVPVIVADPGGGDVREARLPGRWALVLGNEGAGVRPEVMEEAQSLLSISMLKGVDSLNVAVAGAILLFALAPATDLNGEG